MFRHIRIKSIAQLLHRDYRMYRSSFAITPLVLLGLVLLIGYFSFLANKAFFQSETLHESLYAPLLIIFGIITSGAAYREFAGLGTRQDYLLLPASHEEKWISRWLRTAPFYLIGFTIVYYAGAALLTLMIGILHQQWTGWAHPFHNWTGHLWIGYVILNAILLVGAVHFNRYPTMKTLGILIGSMIGFLIYVSVIGLAITFNLQSNYSITEDQISLFNDPPHPAYVWIFGLLNLLFFWWVAFLKLKEKEV